MPEQDGNTSSADALWQPLVDYWTDCVHQAHTTSVQTLGHESLSANPQAWRRQWFDTLGRTTDVYLRSGPFLQMMKAHVDELVRARDGLRAMKKADGEHLGLLGGRDLSELSLRLDQMEETLLARMEQVDRQLGTADNQPGAPPDATAWDRFLSVLRMHRAASRTVTGATPYEVVYVEGSLRLLRYASHPVIYAEPILICFALVNRPYILDLQSDRSVIRILLEKGFDVYLIDWGTPTDADHTLRLKDYVSRFLKNVVEFVCQYSGASQLNMLGYCMGGTMATIFTALYPERVRNLILLATPIDFRSEECLLNLWAREEYFDVDGLIDAYGNCPGEFLQYCFQLMKPVQNFAEKYLTLCEHLDDSGFLDNFFAMERWAKDSVPVAGETFREYVKLLYQQNLLVDGGLSLAGEPVNLDAIECPLLMLVADRDHLVPPDSTLALKQHVRSKEVSELTINAGHIGLAVSAKAHRQLWPEAANWIAEHSTRQG